MSMFSFPADMNTNEMMKSMTAMTDWTKTADLQVSPLMVYPLGAAAAATAVGFGIAGQMAGMMMGAMQGAMQSQASLMGANPDMGWMMPGMPNEPAPAAKKAKPASTAKPVSTARSVQAKSADIVELKPAPAAAPVKAKKTAAKPKKAKPVSAKKTEVEASASETTTKVTTVAVVEKLKSDARIAAAASGEAAPVSKLAKTVPAAALQPEDFRRPAEVEKPEVPDDLKLISGVGPKLEQVLNGLGVWTFSQIAAWQPAEIAWVDDYLQFSGRIDRDDWIAQARRLAKGGATAG